MHDEAPAVRALSVDECWRRLSEGGIACLGLSAAGEPPVLRPVNFAVDGELLIVRTGEGRILDTARRRDGASLLLHGIDKLEHTGWSVVACGILQERESDARHLALPLRPWASGQKDRFVALRVEEVSGLAIPPGRGNR